MGHPKGLEVGSSSVRSWACSGYFAPPLSSPPGVGRVAYREITVLPLCSRGPQFALS